MVTSPTILPARRMVLEHLARLAMSPGTASRPAKLKRATLYLRLLADKTSGYFQYADSTKKLALSFGRIAADLRQQYTIGYYPKNKSRDARPRRIRVEVAVPGVRVETRKSYIYKPKDD